MCSSPSRTLLYVKLTYYARGVGQLFWGRGSGRGGVVCEVVCISAGVACIWGVLFTVCLEEVEA